MRHTLATQYGIKPDLIDLEVDSGSLQIQMTVRAPEEDDQNGFGYGGDEEQTELRAAVMRL